MPTTHGLLPSALKRDVLRVCVVAVVNVREVLPQSAICCVAGRLRVIQALGVFRLRPEIVELCNVWIRLVAPDLQVFLASHAARKSIGESSVIAQICESERSFTSTTLGPRSQKSWPGP